MPRGAGVPGSFFINLIKVHSLQKQCRFYLEKCNLSLISHTCIMHVTVKKEGV